MAKVWVIDIYDAGEHVSQHVLKSKAEADRVGDWLSEHGEEEVDIAGAAGTTGFSISEYEPNTFKEWLKENAEFYEEGEDGEDEDEEEE